MSRRRVKYSSLTVERSSDVSRREHPLAQSAYEGFGRGDIPALAEVMADDIEWVIPGDPNDNPVAGTYRGKEEVLAWFGKLAEDLDFSTFEPRDFIAQGDKVVSIVYAEAQCEALAARSSTMKRTSGHSGAGSSPGSEATSTPARRCPHRVE